MARPKTKEELLVASEENYQQLMDLFASMSPLFQEEPFDLEDAFLAKKKEAHWVRDQNVRDVLIHLYEWQRMLLHFTKSNLSDTKQPFLPAPYNWRNYGQLNREFVLHHQNTSVQQAKELLAESHKEGMILANQFSDIELFTKNYYTWTGSTSLGSYFISSLSSHYEWANKKLKQIMKYKQTK